MTGVGLFYRHGYFRQSLSREGWQQETYPVLDPDELPLTLLREADGSRAIVSIAMPDGPDLLARIFVASVGRVPLLLLDTDIEENPQHYRDVTDRLYGGNSEHRLRQELLLGVGGVRALRVHSRMTGAPAPEVFHTNEGHAGFLGIERIRELTVGDGGPGLDFDTALEVSRAGTVFTTHTPVPAGIDRFPRELVEQYFGGGSSPTPGVPVERVLALGAEDYDGGDAGVFNMAVMGFRLAQRANGVSQLHGHVSRGMFNGLWPAFDEAEVPIGSVTNGVHGPTWIAREIFELAAELGADIDGDDTDALWPLVDQIDGRRLWDLKRTLRARLVEDARARLTKSSLKRGFAPAELGWIDTALDPDVLTIGFARRVPSYKRLTLMLRDPERLKRLLLDPERPIQLVIAGKSHPADDGGKKLIQELVRFADDPEVRHRIVFLPNYDIGMALPLYPGCDVWLNNPLRPYEACGTSGHEGRAQRRAQPVDPRRLVGRVVRRQQRLGDPVGRRDRRRRPSRRPRGRRALRPDRDRGRAALLRRRRRGRAHALAGDGAPHAQVARPEGAGHAPGPRLRARAVCPRGPHLARRSTPTTPAPARSPRGSPPCERPGRPCGSSTSSPTASVTWPRSARSVAVRAFVALADLGVDDVEVQVVHGRDQLPTTT